MGLLQSIAAAFRRFPSLPWVSNKAARSGPGLRTDPAWLGREGERLAARFLRKAGYKILYRNFKTRSGGEVDLVCRLPRVPELVFVEVKTRSSLRHGSPGDAVDEEKRRRIIQSAREWLDLLERDWPGAAGASKTPPTALVSVRFDVVEMLYTEGVWRVRHLPTAFLAEEPLHPGGMPLIPGATRGDVRPKRARAGAAPFRRRRAHD